MKPLVKQNTRFNLFDALIVLVLLVLLTGLVLYLIPQGTTGQSAHISITCNRVPKNLLSLISEGDIVYDQSGNTTLGKITKVEKSRDWLLLTDPESGVSKRAQYPKDTLYAVTLEISATDVTYQAETDTVTVGGVAIAKDALLGLRTARVSLIGTCNSCVVKGGK